MNLSRPIIFFDLETTGISIVNDRIIQIGALKILPDGSTDEKNVLINPGKPIPPDATAVHGISDEDVKDKPFFRQLSKSMSAWFSNCDLAGYNSNKFDIPFLAEEFGRVDILFPEPNTTFIDIYLIEKIINSHKLGETYKGYTGETLENAHDALADVIATHEIFKKQLNNFSDQNITINEIAEFCKGDTDWVDLDKKIYTANGKYYIGFGKHRNTEFSEIPADYFDWIMKGDFTRNTKTHIKRIKEELKI